MHRAIEFILQQQAQYAARFERDESRLARLEESFTMLVELARGTDERWDTMGQTMATLSHSMNELAQRMITLAEVQSQTDTRLTEAQIRLDTKIAESQARSDAKMGELAEAQARTDLRLNSLLDIVERNERNVN